MMPAPAPPSARPAPYWLTLALVVMASPLPGRAATAAPAVDAAAAATVTGAAMPAAVVRFRNDGPGVTVRFAGGPWTPLPGGSSLDVEAEGERLDYRVARGYEWQYSGSVELRDTATRLVVLREPGAHVAVTNRSDEPRDVTWKGRALGRVDRDQRRVFGPVEVGEHELVAIGLRSRHVIAERLNLVAGGLAERTLAPLDVGLEVGNPSDEPVRVLVDQRDFGTLEVGARALLLGLSPGTHDVVLRGMRSGRDQRVEATLRSDVGAAAQQTMLALELDNASGEALRFIPALAGLHDGPIAAGANVRLLLPTRPVRLRLTGEDSGVAYQHDVDPRIGASQRWRVERAVGVIHLRNVTGEDAEVRIGPAEPLALARGASLRVRNVPAGRVEVSVRGVTSGQRFERFIPLAAGQEVSWRVRAGAASLVVHNRHAEVVELSIDGIPRGQVAALSSFRVADATLGEHVVRMRAPRSGTIAALTAVVRDGGQAEVSFEPAGGAIGVRNSGDRPIDVFNAGVALGQVQPGRERAFTLAAGRIFVRIRDADGREATFDGTLAPGQSLPMPDVYSEAPRLVVLNRSALAAKLRVDERGPWIELGAGEVEILADVRDGEHLVELVRGDATIRRRVRLRPGTPDYPIAF